MTFYANIIICILILPLYQGDPRTLSEEERNLIKCCFLKLDCCIQQPTTFEVRALLTKCRTPEDDSTKKNKIITVRKTRSSEYHSTESKCDVMQCKKKIKVTIKIKNTGLTNCKDQYILLDHVFDSITGQKQKLFNPYVFRINQRPIMEIYGLCYEGMVNAQANEAVFNKNTSGYSGCGINIPNNPSCETVAFKNKPIPFSSGFCCSCDTKQKNFNYRDVTLDSNNSLPESYADLSKPNIQERGGQDCNEKYTPPDLNPEAYHASSHCLKFSDLWYFVYRVQKPKIHHTLSLEIFQKYHTWDLNCKWKDVTKKSPIVLGTDSQPFLSDDATIIARYLTVDINDINLALNYNYHKILIPDISSIENFNDYPEIQGGPEEYLVVKSDKVETSGKACDVAGVGYEAFAKQSNRCGVPRGSCLKNQPLDMWEEDNAKRRTGTKGNYFLEYFGLLPENPVNSSCTENKTLSMLFTKTHTSALEIELADNENTILRPNGFAVITEVYTDGTDSQKTAVIAKIFNSGLVASIFYITITDCPLSLPASFSHITSMPALIPPQHQHVFKLDIQCPLTKKNFFCSLHVLNLRKELIAVRKIRLKRSGRCICIWYCACTCDGANASPQCEVLSLLAYHAAGFQGGMPVALQVVEYSFTDYLVSMMVYIIIMLGFTLLLMGLIKALIGLCSVLIGLWGLDVILDLPRKIDSYYENDINHMRVSYDEYGWPVHPDTRVRVRNIPLQAEFCVNIIFFIIYPFCVIWNLLRKPYNNSSKNLCNDMETICYCSQGAAVKRKNCSLQKSTGKK